MTPLTRIIVADGSWSDDINIAGRWCCLDSLSLAVDFGFAPGFFLAGPSILAFAVFPYTDNGITYHL